MSVTAQFDLGSLIEHGVAQHRDGALDEAAATYKRALDIAPDDPRALQLYGRVLGDLGDAAQAAEFLRRAAERDPENVATLNLLAIALGRAGRPGEAESVARQAVRLRPHYADLWMTLGNILEENGNETDAREAFHKALDRQPGHPGAHNNIGLIETRHGRVAEAENHYRAALNSVPDYPDALCNLGILLSQHGDRGEALALLERALTVAPNSVDVLVNLGEALAALGEFANAEKCFSRALARAPDHREARVGLVNALSHARTRRYQPAMDRMLAAIFTWRDVRLDDIAVFATRHFRLKYDLPRSAEEAKDMALDESKLSRLAADKTVQGFLSTCINSSAVFEIALTQARRWLTADRARTAPGAPTFALAAALARQSALNEYVFDTSDAERTLVAEWRNEIENTDWRAVTPDAEATLVRYALFADPARLSVADKLDEVPAASWSPEVASLIGETITAARREHELRGTIPALTEIDDPVSIDVAEQYGENPFPRWTTFTRRTPVSVAAFLKDLFPHFDPPAALDKPIDVLVAGCGTGQHPIAEVALTYRGVRVLAVDLSMANLAYAARKARDIEVKNVEFAQADILNLGILDRQFSLIECGGVLHHLADPVAGWRALKDLLPPGGVMMVALYSRRSHQRISEARQEIARLGFGTDVDSIRAFRQNVFRDADFAEYRDLLKIPAFYSTSACRDLLFQPRQHTFDLPQIAGILDDLGLELIGLQHPEPAVAAQYRNEFPEDGTQTDLAKWDAFEERHPKTFARMYHVWCQRPA